MPQPVVLGLCGSFRSGCTTIADRLRSRGYQVICLSDEVKRLAEKRYGLDPKSRSDLQDAGNRVRTDESPDYLAQWAIAQIKNDNQLVVLDALRNVAEVVALRQAFGRFFLVGVTASRDIRRKRAEADGITGEQFDAIDARDIGENSVCGQQVKLCMEFADAVLRNNDHIRRLDVPGENEKLNGTIAKYHRLFADSEAGYPSPDELVMGVADNAAMQSTCIKRQVGAVICTSDYEIIAVGQNNPPRTERPCKVEFQQCYRDYVREHRIYKCGKCDAVLDEVSCPSCRTNLTRRSLAGKELDYCRSLHAEENAILQMSRRPGSIPDRSILYTTTFPCFLCAKKIATIGVKEVVYGSPYPMEESYELLEKTGVTLTPFEGVRSKAFHRVFSRPPDLAQRVIEALIAEAETAPEPVLEAQVEQ